MTCPASPLSLAPWLAALLLLLLTGALFAYEARREFRRMRRETAGARLVLRIWGDR